MSTRSASSTRSTRVRIDVADLLGRARDGKRGWRSAPQPRAMHGRIVPRPLARVCNPMQDAAMAKDAAVTVRLPLALKRTLEARARRERRSLSAQIAAYLERGVASDPVPDDRPGKLLGLFEGGPVPSDDDFARVRRQLWGTLGKRRSRRGA